MKPGQLKLTALNSNHERWLAYEVALLLKGGATKVAYDIIDLAGSRWLSFFCLVADAIKDGASWEPTTFRRRQIEAWSVAYDLAARRKNGFEITAYPTLGQVKDQFKELFPKASLPADMTFRRTFQGTQTAMGQGNDRATEGK